MPTFASVSKDKDMRVLRIPTWRKSGFFCFCPPKEKENK